jgi:S-methyl-5-thioribose-1-phosphate isomerase
VLECGSARDTAEAIRRLAVRGAPLIGIAAGYGLAMEVARDPARLEQAAAELAGARPTARNLRWAVERVAAAARAGGPDAARAEAEAIEREDVAASAALARAGAETLAAELPERELTVLTHCNTGALAASGRGTALGVIAELAERRPLRVLACETRPLLQGARLTVWELRRLGIEHALLVDSAAAGLMRRGEVDAVITGFDRVAANGDVANKVGTYPLALAARAAGVPFVAAGPSSSVDRDLPTGDGIEIEERAAEEVLGPNGIAGTPCRNPAFDVTPAELVWALVTERGVARPVTPESVARVS